MLLDLLSLEGQQQQVVQPPLATAALAGWESHPRMVERRRPRLIPSAGLDAWMPFVEAGALSLEEAIVLASAQEGT